jgi:hypothetical protein
MMIRNIMAATFAGGLLSVTLLAQTAPITNQQTFTTGMLGFSAGQTAQLNVLNLATAPLATPVSTAIATGSCSVTMEFFNAQDILQNPTTVATVVIAPQKAASVDLPWSSASATGTNPTAGRREVRGVVIGTPTPVATSSVGTGPCNLKITMEIFDSLGNTLAVTSDTSLVSSGILTPSTATTTK